MLDKVLRLIHRHRGYIETGKLIFISLLALIALFVSIYVLWESPWTGFRFIYVFIPHLYLIPIILLALWYPKSGLRLVGIIFISLLVLVISGHIFGYKYDLTFIFLYTGLDLATIMVLLLYVKDRRLVEAVLNEIIERGERKKEESSNRFGGDFDTIINALGSDDEKDRENAVDALSELSDPRIILPLVHALSDKSPFIRRSATGALGKTHSLIAIQPLMKSLVDEDRYVRESSAEALGRLGDLAIPELLKGLKEKDWRIRMGSIIALRVSSGKLTTYDSLLTCLTDESQYVRREAVKTLGRIGDKTIFPYLVQASKDPDPGVRLRAIKALVKHGTKEEIIPVLNRCKNDEDGAVRLRAHEELSSIRDDME